MYTLIVGYKTGTKHCSKAKVRTQRFQLKGEPTVENRTDAAL